VDRCCSHASERSSREGKEEPKCCARNTCPEARNVGKLDDFAYIKDAVLLLALFDLGIIDKGEKGTLEENLDLRNRCGHPTKYKPGVNKSSSFIEDVVGIVF
jgi:hypothetical protein